MIATFSELSPEKIYELVDREATKRAEERGEDYHTALAHVLDAEPELKRAYAQS